MPALYSHYHVGEPRGGDIAWVGISWATGRDTPVIRFFATKESRHKILAEHVPITVAALLADGHGRLVIEPASR